MRLLRLHVVNFGRLCDYRMELTDPLTVLHKENGWGKSTLAAFIKAMLYGLPASTKRSLDRNDRKRYTPWQGGAFGGSLELETARGTFRIERFFGDKESADTFELYDLSTNRPSDAYSDRIGEELFGIDADGFERTVYLAQRAVPVEGENTSITAKLGNLLDAVDDVGSYDAAVKALEDRRRFYVMTGNRGHIAELEKERAERRREHDSLCESERALAEKEQLFASERDEIARVQSEMNEVRRRLSVAGEMRERAAHTEQKNQMLADLAEAEGRKSELDVALGGNHPTDAELAEQRSLWEQYRNAKARLDAIPAEGTGLPKTELLPAEAIDKCPDASLLNRLSEENAKLVGLCNRGEVLRGTLRQTQGGFENGVPTDDDMEKMYGALERITRTGDVQVPKGSRLWIPSVIAFVLGTVCGLLALANVVPPLLLLLCGVFCAAGMLLLTLWIVQNARDAKNAGAAAKRREQERADEREAVRRFLNAYGVSAEGDLSRRLDTLAAMVEQHRRNEHAAREYRVELNTVDADRHQLLTVMRSEFRLFGLELPEQKDYHAQIGALMRDLAALEGARRTEEARRRRRAEEQTALNDAKAALLPFLQRYDPAKRSHFADVLQRVEQDELEYRRLTTNVRAQTERLTAFIREKGLDAEVREQDLPITETAEQLDEKADALQTRMEGLLETQSRLGEEISRIRDDVDRLTDVETQLSALDEQIEQATANSRTIELTKKYLETAKESLSTRYLSDMQSSFSELLALLIEEEPPEAVMDTSFEVALRAGGKTRPVESFSRGWRDAVQFCVRLSLTDALYKDGERPFLLLDDPFVNLDDSRLAAAKRLLEKLSEQYQILYMVCHADRG